MSIPTIAMIPSGYKANKIYSVLPTNGDADLDFTRASEATRVNQNGLIETVGVNLPRYNFDVGETCPSLLIEPQSTNLYLNSETLSTQNVTTLASTYTVSFYGTGTITFTGSYSGSLVGTGANDRVTLTFTATAGTLTSTISGSVKKGQLENLGYATSYIPTAATTVQRNKEVFTKTGLTSYINSQQGVIYLDCKVPFTNIQKDLMLTDGTSLNFLGFNFLNNNITAFYKILSGVQSAIPINYTETRMKLAFLFSENNFKFFINGSQVGADTLGSVAPANTFDTLSSNRSPFNDWFGEIYELQIYNTTLTDAELITLTTL